MINANISNSDNSVYIDVSGYISHDEAMKFLQKYKQLTRNFRASQYKLVVTPSIFECENNEDIRTVCMLFLKTGYKKMYLVDPKNHIMSNLSLGFMEKKLFTKSVKIVSDKSEIK